MASWFGLDAGYLKPVKRAEIGIINPQHLDGDLAAYHEDESLMV